MTGSVCCTDAVLHVHWHVHVESFPAAPGCALSAWPSYSLTFSFEEPPSLNAEGLLK